MMNTTELKNKVTRKLYKVKFGLKKHSPEILVVAGTVGVVTSAVMACKATLKVNAVIDEAKENLNKIEVAGQKGVTEAGETYTEEDVKNLLEKGSLDELKDCLDFAPEGTVELVKKVAVETELNDIRKRNAIQEATGFNINSAIEINKETSEERPEETKVRRASAPKKEDAQVSTGRRVSAPTTSKYKIVNSK